MYVTKDLLCPHLSSATLHVHKLVVHHVEADDGHSLLDTTLVFLQHFGIRIGRWNLLGSIYDFPKVQGNKTISILSFQRLNFSQCNLSMTLVFCALNVSHLTLKECVCTLKTFKSGPQDLTYTPNVFNLCLCSIKFFHSQMNFFGSSCSLKLRPLLLLKMIVWTLTDINQNLVLSNESSFFQYALM